MLKARAGNALIIGELLKAGKPIAFDAGEFRLPALEGLKVMIMYGETEQSMMTELQAAIAGGTHG